MVRGVGNQNEINVSIVNELYSKNGELSHRIDQLNDNKASVWDVYDKNDVNTQLNTKLNVWDATTENLPNSIVSRDNDGNLNMINSINTLSVTDVTIKNLFEKWTDIATSIDGQFVIAIANTYYLYLSNDGGLTWKQLMLNFASTWNSVDMSSDGKYITIGTNNFIYVSSDYGNTFNSKINDTTRNWTKVAMSSDGSRQTCLASNDSIYISSDYGDNWTSVSTFMLNGVSTSLSKQWSSLAMSDDGKYQTAVLESDRIYYSTDFGNNWTVNGNIDIYRDITMSADGVNQYTITYWGRIYWSTNSGATWNGPIQLSDTLSLSPTKSLIKVTSDNDYIIIGYNRQLYKFSTSILNSNPSTFVATSQTIMNQKIFNKNPYSQIAISSNKSAIYVALNPGNIFKSVDNGNTWIGETTQSSYSTSWDYCAMSSDGTYRLISNSENNVVYLSSDNGMTWTEKLNNFTWTNLAISGDGKYQLALANSTMFRSSDYGNTWTENLKYVSPTNISYIQLALQTFGRPPAQAKYYFNLSFQQLIETGISADLVNLIMNTQTNFGSKSWVNSAISSDGRYQTALSTFGFIYVSTNYGMTWFEIQNGVTSTNASVTLSRGWRDIAMTPDGKIQFAIVSSGNFYKSINYGENWTEINTSTFSSTLSTGSNWSCTSISNDGSTIIVCNTGNAIIKSSDIGTTWTRLTSPTLPSIGGIAMSSDGKYMSVHAGLTNSNQIYVSNNYGVSWSAKYTNATFLYRNVAMTSDGKTQMILSRNNVLYSYNYGNTWDIYYNKYSFCSLSASKDKYVVGVVKSGDICVSNDYGDTWIPRNKLNTWTRCCLSNDGKYMYASALGSDIYISSDYGVTWLQKENIRLWNDIDCSQDGKYVSAVASEGHIYVSDDYGNTWNNKQYFRQWSNISLSNDGKYQTATSATGVYVSNDYGNSWSLSLRVNLLTKPIMSDSGKLQTITTGSVTRFLSNDYGNSWNYTSYLYTINDFIFLDENSIISTSGNSINYWNIKLNMFKGLYTFVSLGGDSFPTSLCISNNKTLLATSNSQPLKITIS
jgi:photosystem II stability/assembly factor-like uncharacterized protein